MRSFRRRIAWTAALLSLALLVLAAPARSQSSSCDANVVGNYRTEEVYDEHKDKIFSVQISSPSPCARVTFDLVTTERLFNGEEIKMTTSDVKKVTAGAESAFKVKFRMANDSELVDWQIKFRSCSVCGN